MPRDYTTRLSAAQQDTLVEFLLSQEGEEPTPEAVGSGAAAATPLPKPAAAAKVVPPSSRLSSLTVAQIVLALVVLIVSGYAIFRERK